MTPLEQELKATIKLDGPMPLERYMGHCLAHPEHGYYMSRDPFGRGGDFTTAPEITQMFGELIGIWCLSTWKMLDAPDPLNLIELGPGRGTLMADLLRATNIMPGFAEATSIHLVETSPALKTAQQKTLKNSGFNVSWHSHIGEVPQGLSLIIANEFLDALPVRQLQLTDTGWHERMVGLDDEGAMQIGLSADPLPASLIPAWAHDEQLGAIVEIAPARQDYCNDLAERMAANESAALFIDYGHARPGPGDTIQAVQKHNSVDILHEPGQSDLTAHVDFAAAAECFTNAGLKTYPVITQSRFLAGMGLAERAQMLAKRGDSRHKMTIQRAAERLAAGNQMGQLFKVLIAAHSNVAELAPFAQMSEEN